MNVIFERIGIAVVLILAYVITVWFYRYINRLRFRNDFIKTPLPVDIKPGLPTLLYFWTPDCVQCRSQEIYLEDAASKLKQRGKELNVKKINAQQENEFASLFRIITVPTIVLVDPNGNIAIWNPGLMQSKRIVNLFSGLLKK
jgi:thiol-disulfide isomerase/thioredoxin